MKYTKRILHKCVYNPQEYVAGVMKKLSRRKRKEKKIKTCVKIGRVVHRYIERYCETSDTVRADVATKRACKCIVMCIMTVFSYRCLLDDNVAGSYKCDSI